MIISKGRRLCDVGSKETSIIIAMMIANIALNIVAKIIFISSTFVKIVNARVSNTERLKVSVNIPTTSG